MRSNCGFVKSDSPEEKFAKLAFETGGVAVHQTRHRGQPRQRGGQRGVVGKPEQIERRAASRAASPAAIAASSEAVNIAPISFSTLA